MPSTLMQEETFTTKKDQPPSPQGSRDGADAAYPELRTRVEEISLHEPLLKLWLRRRVLLRFVAVFVTAGIVFAIGSRKEYEAGVTLMPEKEQGGMSVGAGLGLLQQFGGILGGIDGSSLLNKGNALPVQIYPDILHSTPVLHALLERRVVVPSLDTTVTLFTYLDRMKSFSLWDEPVAFVAKVPSDVVGRLTADELPAAGASLPVRLSPRESRIIEELRDRLGASLDKKTGVLRVSVKMPDAYVAAQVADAAVGEVTQYVTDYRLKKLQQDLLFVEERHAEAKSRYNYSWQELARFRDRNQHLSRDLAKTEEQRLQAEYDLALNVYNSLASRLEEARIRVQEETPIFQVLQPVTVPLRKKSPQTALIIILCGLMGLGVGGAFVLLRSEGALD